jgi:uncharacterized protein YehS (DUF1456 family)
MNNYCELERDYNRDLIILKALDIIEDLRQRSFEAPLDDMDFRVAAADVAELFEDPELHNRANWTDLLKADAASRYHKRYFAGKGNLGVFHS